MHSYTEENYLKALFNLANPKGEVSANELSKKLEIKMPTVNSMMKKLADKKLVFYESYKPLRLTEKGRREAGLIIRKHRLTEMYLVQKMDFGWEQVHEIAEQMEHLHAPHFFEKMDEILGFPTIDPHGSPIPDKSGKISWKQYDKLSDRKAGDTIKLAAVINGTDDFFSFLNSRGLKLGVKIRIQSIESFDGSMLVSYNKKTAETFSHTVAERLLVEDAS
ncbi:MAG: metal-dependent transcriptional regulator [Chitinophagaceae bacterium]|nr:MAG: metal-dependent transcriptional regulator [Chitinophagaceae bacterium]